MRKSFALMVVFAIVLSLLHAPTTQGDDVVIVSVGVVTLLEMNVDNEDIDLGVISPGNAQTGTSTITVTTNSEHGYQLSAHRSSPDYLFTLRHSSGLAYLIDKPEFDGQSGSTAIWDGAGFGFTVYQATDKSTVLWGTGTSVGDVNNRYTGFPESSRVVHSVATNVTSDQTKIGYKADVTSAQRPGSYYGDVTYTATVIP